MEGIVFASSSNDHNMALTSTVPPQGTDSSTSLVGRALFITLSSFALGVLLVALVLYAKILRQKPEHTMVEPEFIAVGDSETEVSSCSSV
ncbi:hypothetical protein Ae201684P_004650 [Aphanomyces euteiches]|uniref:Uncharacterized protein n=1 Tax=Aphanomyces euteiches TaxID=100861 RepID=A0A6G0XD19_9STRA|nr:hypothetical protein Ae201684_005953 [Aphanomyces euteiches]KAH9068953.1 hypothetical protein Ae201684P_004650 [Aphanomyces euteiches]KAH9137577.1 hypothetical protein AeRB84_017779 [Aphanomyces euteiches]